ncbi:MAG: Eco57I restriction-modification methylase domain-containing protein [Promethearchaeota archaeon]
MIIKKNDTIVHNSIGQIFTPRYLAKFMVENIKKLINNSPDNQGLNENYKNLRVLDPATGTGVFLEQLVKYNFNDITAYELDINLKKDLKNLYPNVNFRFEDYLGADINEKFDIIIGNPPYLGQNYNSELFRKYNEQYPICRKFFVGNMDLFYYFIHLGIEMLNPGGLLSFITTNYWITKSKKTGIKHLKPHIVEECFLNQYIDLSNLKIFKDALGQHNCIFTLQKKTEEEKIKNLNENIEVIKIQKKPSFSLSDESYNRMIFERLIHDDYSPHIKRYHSSLSNNDLPLERSWNLLFPEEVKVIVNKIKKYCRINDKNGYLKDYFIVRNGLILIKDDIFILKPKINIKVKGKDFFIKIGKYFYKLEDSEKIRLKKIYKSKCIKPYGFENHGISNYLIYFNKNEFAVSNPEERNKLIEQKYPTLSLYIRQYEKEIKQILTNAKENPSDIYFPRRGSFIIKFDDNRKQRLVDLEPFYDNGPKIFFKYISEINNFGFSDNSYYATSDTYFLWPISNYDKGMYYFLIAYLNSKIVEFLFKAKNISIKRSKTKLENGLMIPNLELFKAKKERSIISLIKLLSLWLIQFNLSNEFKALENSNNEILALNTFSKYNDNSISVALKERDQEQVKKSIDKLLFRLFKLDEKEIVYLMKKYYNF